MKKIIFTIIWALFVFGVVPMAQAYRIVEEDVQVYTAPQQYQEEYTTRSETQELSCKISRLERELSGKIDKLAGSVSEEKTARKKELKGLKDDVEIKHSGVISMLNKHTTQIGTLNAFLVIVGVLSIVLVIWCIVITNRRPAPAQPAAAPGAAAGNP